MTLLVRAARPPGGRPAAPAARLGAWRRRGPVGPKWWVPWLFLAPGLAFFGVFFAWPAVTAAQLAFYDYDVVSPPHFVGTGNFVRMAHSAEFWQAFGNSLLFLAMFLPFVVVVPLVLAIVVNRRLRGIGAFRLAYYLPVVTSMVAISIAWSFLFHPKGALNWLLLKLGIIDTPIQFLLDRHWALPAVVLVEAWQYAGYFMMIYLAGLQSIPGELYEAAALDGAGAWSRFRRVTVPLIRPYAAVCCVLAGILATQSFASTYVLTRGGPQGATTTLGYYIWSRAFEHFDFGYASAVGLVLWAFLLSYALVQYRLTRGEPAG
ncbi:MAG TPA: sugar ABC transporter permease [Actinophytocola sp.]|nr:sugar ABC transporter permease [Actinophytocola sp.]